MIKKKFTHRADFPVFGKSGLRNFLHKDDFLKFRKSADFPFFGKSAFPGLGVGWRRLFTILGVLTRSGRGYIQKILVHHLGRGA